jgi:transposase-like protein
MQGVAGFGRFSRMENQIGELRRSRRRYSAEEKRRIIVLYEESGLSRSEFCRREGIGLINLQRWLGKKQRGELAAGKRSGARFVEVEARSSVQAGRYRLGLGAERWLEIESGFDEREVRVLAGIVREGAGC